MTNYQSTIENYINRITELQGTLFHIWSILRKDYQKVFERYMNSEIDDHPSLISNILVISDITGPTDNGWEYNYPAGNSRNIPYSKYETEIVNLVSRESAFMCAQSHEAFETYIKQQVGNAIVRLKKRPSKNQYRDIDITSESNCLTSLSKFKWGVNNKDLFKILREICPEYSNYETNNNLGFNLYDWYTVFAEARHAIIHSQSKIQKRNFSKFSAEQNAILEQFYKFERDGDEIRLLFSKQLGDQLMKRISEIAFTIFKALAIQSGDNWKIMKDMRE